MTGWRQPKDPQDVPKAIRLRERARALKAQGDLLLKHADALLEEAQRLEAETPKKRVRDDVNQAAARTIREATER